MQVRTCLHTIRAVMDGVRVNELCLSLLRHNYLSLASHRRNWHVPSSSYNIALHNYTGAYFQTLTHLWHNIQFKLCSLGDEALFYPDSYIIWSGLLWNNLVRWYLPFYAIRFVLGVPQCSSWFIWNVSWGVVYYLSSSTHEWELQTNMISHWLNLSKAFQMSY